MTTSTVVQESCASISDTNLAGLVEAAKLLWDKQTEVSRGSAFAFQTVCHAFHYVDDQIRAHFASEVAA